MYILIYTVPVCSNFRPLLKLVDRLLLVGMLSDDDVVKLLIMFNPETWDPTFEKGQFLEINKINCVSIKLEELYCD